MNKLRLRYSKTGKAKYISHLDLSATMQRALIRAGIALKYSEGFNPHPYMSVALPLSVGMESVCELMDVGLIEALDLSELPGQITHCLPEGISIIDAYYSPSKFAMLAWVEISGTMHYSGGVPQDAAKRLAERFSEDVIEISKKTKRGFSTINISEFISDISFDGSDEIVVRAKLSAQNPTLNPGNLLDALSGEFSELAPDFSSFRRIEAFDTNMNVFR